MDAHEHCRFIDNRPGRPRERVWVSEHPNRLDANAVRREATATGIALESVGAVDVRHSIDGRAERVRVAVVCVPHPLYRVRLWLVCPACGGRRVHLYLTRGRGVGCRRCMGLAYALRK